MTALEKEILGAMYEPIHATVSQEDAEKAATAISLVCRKYIEKAYDQGVMVKSVFGKKEWLKENGITE
jgi:hypothetical protein